MPQCIMDAAIKAVLTASCSSDTLLVKKQERQFYAFVVECNHIYEVMIVFLVEFERYFLDVKLAYYVDRLVIT